MDFTMTLDPIDGQALRLSETIPSSEKLCRFAGRYPAKLRAPVLSLAAADPRLAQAMRVFPGLLAELARKPAGCPLRETCTRLILDGASLKDVAHAAGLPLWMRRLPPEAFERPLPNGIATLLPSHEIANHLPRSPKQAARWLDVVIEAALVCDGRFATWLAREHRDWPRKIPRHKIRSLGLFSWYAINTDRRPATIPHSTWTRAKGCKTAYEAAIAWLERINVRLTLAAREPTPWLHKRRWGGFEFVPLVTGEEIDAEARAMENCLLAYGADVRSGRCQLWSIRRDGRRIATMAVGGYRNYPLISIQQIAGYKNKTASTELWHMAETWFHEHSIEEKLHRKRASSSEDFDRQVWVETWRPYWMSKRRIPSWLPLRPDCTAIDALLNGRE